MQPLQKHGENKAVANIRAAFLYFLPINKYMNKWFSYSLHLHIIMKRIWNVLLTLLLPQPWHMYPKWDIPSLCAALLDKRAPSLPNDNTALNSLVLTNSGFSKRWCNLVWSCNCPLRVFTHKRNITVHTIYKMLSFGS